MMHQIPFTNLPSFLTAMSVLTTAMAEPSGLMVDPTQTRYNDAPIATPTPMPGETETQPIFTMYSIGSDFEADTGDGKASCDVRNETYSTHDIVMYWAISAEELAAHNLSTEGLETGSIPWVVAETGLFEPGYGITAVQLLPLPDGSYLPRGTYNLSLIEYYYDHLTGEKFPYEQSIPITLTILR
jgi:hypothetical protein